MARSRTELKTFNRGLISPLALARTDLERTALSAETMTNWMPRDLGSMMLRPGTSYIGNTASNNAAKLIPFVFASDDTALIELTDSLARVWVNDALVTRPSVSTAITNGDFTSDLTGWTDDDEIGAPGSAQRTADTQGYMELAGADPGQLASIRTQEVTVAAGDQNVEHALDILIGLPSHATTGYVASLPVTIRVGSTDGDDDYITETKLDEGYHSLSFTPTGNFWVQFSNRAPGSAFVNSVAVASSGVMTLTAPWAAADLGKIRWDQSADVIYVACEGYHQYKIERRSTTSWSVARYYTYDGPFDDINTSGITITSASLSGFAASLTSPVPLFKSTDVGRLLKMVSDGQTVVASPGADDTWTNAIKVTGVTTSRIFTITRAGTWTTTVSLQRSLTSDTGPWEEVATYTTNGTVTYDDSLDNQTAWYRIGFDTGWDTGTATLTLDYPSGSIEGIGRIKFLNSSSNAVMHIYQTLGSTDATENWYWGSWSDHTGYPSAVSLVEGRLGWAGANKVWLSESDDYAAFDDNTIGDSGPITRTIGSGPVDNINFLLALRRLILGTDSMEFALRSSSDDEPLTPSNASIKAFSFQGSAEVMPTRLDNNAAIFIQRGGVRVYELAFGQDFEYTTNDLTPLVPSIGSPGIVRMAVQKQPDTRIHCVRSDGTVAVLIHDRSENVSAWVNVTVPGTSAVVEDVAVLPGADGSAEDAVYYVVARTVNSSTVRFLERWSLESECQGGTTSKQMDASVTGTVTGGSMSGLDHLEGESVVAWVNGKDAGSGTVSSGSVSGLTENGSGTVGLSYTAQFKSTKLGELIEKKVVHRVGVIMYNTHYQGLQYGPTFDDLDNLPQVKDGSTIADDTVHTAYDEETFSFDGRWDSDSRVCLQAASPRPCTLLAAIVDMED